MSDTHNDELEQFIEDYLSYLDGTTLEPNPDLLSEGNRGAAHDYVRILEHATGTMVPVDLADDEVARRLGFDRAGVDIDIDGTRVRVLRQATGLVLKDLAAQVNAAGGSVTTAELLKVERSTAYPMAQPTVSALAAVLQADVAAFESTSDEVDELRKLLDSPEFDRVIAEWAEQHGSDTSEIRSRVHREVLAVQFRAESVSPEHLMEIVKAILDALE